jgi:hypothetical protein
MTDYVAVRNFLLAQTIFVNACRSGVLANMTIAEFSEAREINGNKLFGSFHGQELGQLFGP